ncbi:MAG: hypothetical protein M3Y18_06940 [Candidatus Eremiobacteraeota bacterium]|nr:hypothetical protein [Candidatus Eremiobacteraeota bacterium]
MNERNDTFENELTEEDLPEPQKREDVAENLRLDPETDSQVDGSTLAGEQGSLERARAVYGDTDLNPNAEDQKSAHHAEPDEHV